MPSASQPVRAAVQGQTINVMCNLLRDLVITKEQQYGGHKRRGVWGMGKWVSVAHLPNHAPEGIALDAMQRHSNQDLMEHSRNAKANQQAQPLFVPFGLSRDVDVLNHPLVNRHVPQGPILANALGIPPSLHAPCNQFTCSCMPLYACVHICHPMHVNMFATLCMRRCTPHYTMQLDACINCMVYHCIPSYIFTCRSCLHA